MFNSLIWTVIYEGISITFITTIFFADPKNYLNRYWHRWNVFLMVCEKNIVYILTDTILLHQIIEKKGVIIKRDPIEHLNFSTIHSLTQLLLLNWHTTIFYCTVHLQKHGILSVGQKWEEPYFILGFNQWQPLVYIFCYVLFKCSLLKEGFLLKIGTTGRQTVKIKGDSPLMTGQLKNLGGISPNLSYTQFWNMFVCFILTSHL